MSCVFCDQKQITARSKAPTIQEVKDITDTWLTTLRGSEDPAVDQVELAFYGGSFTAIPEEMQNRYLEAAQDYLAKGLIDGIHLSTRPDCIDRDILSRLQGYGVDTIELGVQSFDDNVLTLSKRGHDSGTVRKACGLIKEQGLNLGVQLMVGLPGDSLESCIYSAQETVKLQPHLARIYPTLVLPNTELMAMYQSGSYTPLSREEALLRTKAIYEILDNAGIYIMRVGLKSTDIINNQNLGDVNRGAYHPAFRQLVETEIARDRIEAKLALLETLGNDGVIRDVNIFSSPLWLSNGAGHNGSNLKYSSEKYPNLKLHFFADSGLAPGDFRVERAKSEK